MCSFLTFKTFFTMGKTFEEKVIDLLRKYNDKEEVTEEERLAGKHMKLIKCSGKGSYCQCNLRNLNLNLIVDGKRTRDRPVDIICAIRKT